MLQVRFDSSTVERIPLNSLGVFVTNQRDARRHNALAESYREVYRLAMSINTIPYNIWVLLPDYLQRYIHSEQVQILITKAL